MAYLIAGVLLGAAVAILTLPWSRRDPDDFTPVEVGYAWRGPRGAVVAALNVLADAGVVTRRNRLGLAERRPGKRLARGGDELVRAVYDALDVPRDVTSLLDRPQVEERWPAMEARVRRAGLRLGPVRRAAGSAMALAAPVIALVALAHGAGNAVVGVLTLAVSVGVAGWLAAQHGVTAAGRRTLPRVRGLRDAGRGGISQTSADTGADTFGGGY